MNEFHLMNIFFVISAIGFVVIAIILCVALFYVVQLLRTLNKIANTVEGEAQALKEDFESARASVKREGLGLLSLFGFMGKTGKRYLKKKKR